MVNKPKFMPGLTPDRLWAVMFLLRWPVALALAGLILWAVARLWGAL